MLTNFQSSSKFTTCLFFIDGAINKIFFLNATLALYTLQCNLFKRYPVDKFLCVKAVCTGGFNTCLEKKKAEALSTVVLSFETRPQRPMRNLCSRLTCTLHERMSKREMEIVRMVAQGTRKLKRQLRGKEEKRRDQERVSQEKGKEKTVSLADKLYLPLAALCSTLLQNDPLLRRSCTSLLYKGKVFRCLCDTGRVATIINAFKSPPGDIPGLYFG